MLKLDDAKRILHGPKLAIRDQLLVLLATPDERTILG